MDDIERITARIQKMLKLANDSAATEGERDNAMRMAHATMAKYNLDMAEVEAAGGGPTESRGTNTSTFFGRPWARLVASSMAKLFFCKYIYIPNSDAKRIRHQFIGLESNATTAAEMTKYLVESILRESRSSARSAGQTSAWARSFAKGSANAIWSRVLGMIRNPNLPDVSASRALVLVDRYKLEDAKNQELLETLYPKLKAGRQGTAPGNGYLEGMTYGNTVNLNRQVTGGQSKALLS